MNGGLGRGSPDVRRSCARAVYTDMSVSDRCATQLEEGRVTPYGCWPGTRACIETVTFVMLCPKRWAYATRVFPLVPPTAIYYMTRLGKLERNGHR